MRSFLLKKSDGRVVTIGFCADAGDEIIDRDVSSIMQSYAGVSCREITGELLPDKDFYDAWCDETPEPCIDIDMAKAKEIALGRLRAQRDEELKKLDGPYMFAAERNDIVEMAAISGQKQVLRDVTNPLKAIDAIGYNNEAMLAQIKQLSTI